MGLPLKIVGTLVAKDMEKVEILDAFFASVSTGRVCLKSLRSEPVLGSRGLKNYPQYKIEVETN